MAASVNIPVTISYHTILKAVMSGLLVTLIIVDLLMSRVYLEMGSPETFQKSDGMLKLFLIQNA